MPPLLYDSFNKISAAIHPFSDLRHFKAIIQLVENVAALQNLYFTTSTQQALYLGLFLVINILHALGKRLAMAELVLQVGDLGALRIQQTVLHIKYASGWIRKAVAAGFVDSGEDFRGEPLFNGFGFGFGAS